MNEDFRVVGSGVANNLRHVAKFTKGTGGTCELTLADGQLYNFKYAALTPEQRKRIDDIVGVKKPFKPVAPGSFGGE